MARAPVELQGVWKRYRLGARRSPVLGLFGDGRPELIALRDVSLHVAPGESVGLVGHNGAGKTTALKLLAGITRPTRGQVQRHGRIASLINLGAGFHPELTGRENVLLNGVILGLSRREVRDRFQAIVEFADLGPFIDTPLKRYSSGMAARLGFAVAAHVDADVLLVDEVLSVGDVAFQDRSIRKMLSFRDEGRAIVFVSHNLSAIEMMCQRVVWLDHGRVRLDGPTAEVVRAYLDAIDATLLADAASDGRPTRSTARRPAESADEAATSVVAAESSAGADTDADPESAESLVVLEASLHGVAGDLRTDFEYGEPARVRLRCLARLPVEQVACRVTVRGDYGPLFSADSRVFRAWPAGPHDLECCFEHLPLLPGLYRVEVLLAHAGTAVWAVPRTLAAFRIRTDLAAFGSDSLVGATKSRGGFLAVPYDWHVRSAAGERSLPGLRLPSIIAPP